jgi:fatty acid desaturase
MVGIWAVHQACENDRFTARTPRSKLLNTFVYGMFYHLEHHLYPRVPTCHLHILAQRLDEVSPIRRHGRQVTGAANEAHGALKTVLER